ncbi:MAG: MOSC domain-containing protein [Armatimonadetes bacterium]|nr:MOSC domain-containing protein [Armatimonadota bacterium]
MSVNPEGGVPKRRVEAAKLGFEGVEGDRQNNRKYHGGPERAVCLFSLEVIETLRAEGHPIEAGAIGENLTVVGLDWSAVTPTVRLQIGEAQLEITSYTRPCYQIRASFADGKFMRPWQKTHPGQSRVYARVLKEAVVREGDAVSILQN